MEKKSWNREGPNQIYRERPHPRFVYGKSAHYGAVFPFKKTVFPKKTKTDFWGHEKFSLRVGGIRLRESDKRKAGEEEKIAF